MCALCSCFSIYMLMTIVGDCGWPQFQWKFFFKQTRITCTNIHMTIIISYTYLPYSRHITTTPAARLPNPKSTFYIGIDLSVCACICQRRRTIEFITTTNNTGEQKLYTHMPICETMFACLVANFKSNCVLLSFLGRTFSFRSFLPPYCAAARFLYYVIHLYSSFTITFHFLNFAGDGTATYILLAWVCGYMFENTFLDAISYTRHGPIHDVVRGQETWNLYTDWI